MTTNRISTGRDPFARLTIRKRLEPDRHACWWCGNRRDRGMWAYYVDADSARQSGDIRGVFCNVGCLNAYHSN